MQHWKIMIDVSTGWERKGTIYQVALDGKFKNSST